MAAAPRRPSWPPNFSTPSHGAVEVSWSTGKDILASVADSHKRKWQGGCEVIPRSWPNSARKIRVNIGVNKDRESSWRIPWVAMVKNPPLLGWPILWYLVATLRPVACTEGLHTLVDGACGLHTDFIL